MTADEIEQEAARWLAARDAGSLTAQQEAELTAWLQANDRHQAVYVRLEASWEEADRFQRLRGMDAAVNPDLLRIKKSRSLLRLPWMWAMAICILSAGMFWGLSVRALSHYQTAVGGFARIPLPDGSVMNLKTDSEVQVSFGTHHREVTLLRGEAQFNVVHDPHRAFDVHVGHQMVRAVGTAFSVRRLSQDGMQVVVTQGRVAVVPPTVSLADIPVSALPTSVPLVMAGEQAESKAAGTVSVHKLGSEVANHAVAWVGGRLWFDRVSLAEAVAEFNRYNTRQVVIEDVSIANLHIGGAFGASDLESFGAALQSFGIVVDESDPAWLKLKAGR